MNYGKSNQAARQAAFPAKNLYTDPHPTRSVRREPSDRRIRAIGEKLFIEGERENGWQVFMLLTVGETTHLCQVYPHSLMIQPAFYSTRDKVRAARIAIQRRLALDETVTAFLPDGSSVGFRAGDFSAQYELPKSQRVFLRNSFTPGRRLTSV